MAERSLRVLLLLVPAILYLLFPTRNFYWDGVSFAIDIERHSAEPQLLHPNHLIYTMFGSWVRDAARAIGWETRALFAMQTANACIAALAVILLYRVMRSYQRDEWVSLWSVLLFAFSATWWKFATDADAYIPSICLLIGAYLTLRKRWPAVVAGLLTTAAMLFHQLAIFFIPVGLLKLSGRRARAIYGTAAVVPVISAYAWAFYSLPGRADYGGFFAWITRHSGDSAFLFNPFVSLFLTARGMLRLFFGGRLGDAIPDIATWAALAGMVLVLGALVRNLARGAWRWRWKEVERPLWVWIAVYLVFLLFWMPQNTFYRLFYLPALVAAITLAASRTQFARSTLAALAAAAILWNFTFVIRPQALPEFNPALLFANAQTDRWPDGAIIAYREFHPDLWTISYFAPQAAWTPFPEFDSAKLDQWLAASRSAGLPLWLEATAFDMIETDPRGQAWLQSHPSGAALIYTDRKHEFRFHPVR